MSIILNFSLMAIYKAFLVIAISPLELFCKALLLSFIITISKSIFDYRVSFV